MEAVLEKLNAMSLQLEAVPNLLQQVQSMSADMEHLQRSCEEANRKLDELSAKFDSVDHDGGTVADVYVKTQSQDPNPPMINYGVGMACSFFEGYLTHIIPDDGTPTSAGFEKSIKQFENQQGIVFPVKRLFIVISKSLFCPPRMDFFNKANRPDLPELEGIESLEEVRKDVAGVKDRQYRNSAYKINRGDKKPPVYLAAEFATPLNTLHKVLQKRAIYSKLCDVNVQEIVDDFCEQLQNIIDASPDCRGKCELVHFDDKTEHLPDVLLNKIKQIEPEFEAIISRANAQRLSRVR